MREFWPVERGYRTIYNEFRQRFGDRTLRHLAARALDEAHVEVRQGLTEDEIEKALVIMMIEAVCMTFLDKGEFMAALNEKGEVVWRTIGEQHEPEPGSGASVRRLRSAKIRAWDEHCGE
jgi:hypothetical protein